MSNPNKLNGEEGKREGKVFIWSVVLKDILAGGKNGIETGMNLYGSLREVQRSYYFFLQ